MINIKGNAPPPFLTPDEEENLNDNNNINNDDNNNDNDNVQLIESKEFEMKYEDKIFKIIISMSSDFNYLYIQSKEKDNLVNLYENRMSFEDLKKFDKIFKVFEDIKESFPSILTIFDYKENLIKEIDDNKLIITINILNLDKTYRKKDLELLKKNRNKDELIGILCQQVNDLKQKNIELENQLNIIKNENNTIKNNFSNFKNDINKEIITLKEDIKRFENNSIKINSNIIANKIDYNLILRRLKKVKLDNNHEENVNQNVNISFNLLYRASEDGDEAKTFHSKCDGIRNTLVVVLTNKGRRFGGFTCETWDGVGLDKKDRNAFCFSLDNMKIYNSVKGKSAIYVSPNSGPAFQNCIFEIKDNCFKEGGACSDESNFYYDNHEKNCEINGEEETFDVQEVEVFSVLFN